MSVAPKYVYTGIWTDWTKDSQVLGSTITVTASASRLLTAFLALYISLSVSYLWLLVVYSIHRARYSITTGKCRAIIRQQHVILKSGLSPTSTSIRLIKLYWAYRFTPSAWRESWLWVSISVISAVGGVTAGLFSSRIIDSSLYVNVLLDSPNCGFFIGNGGDTHSLSSPKVINQYRDHAKLLNQAAKYSRDCYNSTGDNGQCNFFSSATIPWETDWEVECPFDSMCIGPAMRLDTGLMNSNSLLGINSPAVDQIGVRKVTTCAPILQKGYAEPEISPVTGNLGVSYYYGSKAGLNVTWLYEEANNTFFYSVAHVSCLKTNNLNYPRELVEELRGRVMPDVTNDVATDRSTGYNGGVWARKSLWLPIRELNNTQGDGTILFISSNSVLFTEPCDDPVFSAHIPRHILDDNTTVVESNVCSIVGSLGDVYLEVTEKMSLTPMQFGTADMIAFVLDRTGRINYMTTGSTPYLAATQRAIRRIQLGLPRNQWQVETQFWHSGTMSLIQHGILQYMIGPDDEALQEYVTASKSPELQALCKRQRVRISQGFANVSSLGLFFTVSLGTVVILLALFLDNIMGWVTRLSKGDGKKHRAWIRDDVLHLQRLAYEQQQSSGPRWISDDNIPLVEYNGFLDPISGSHQNRLSVDSFVAVDGTP
ncbi:hypothetical protein EKO27_g2109 [Xylaria grammica]|uniref:Uncharacterized protein n=1 Tax=Xylaria grammica TaxID=363999 RepID=A0A439DEZ0_9PEZI|nr:hypothetical protein EKO27_g2109 [Xylaria grammica]